MRGWARGLFLAAALASPAALAETAGQVAAKPPPDVAEHLASQPATLLDLGIMRLEAEIARVAAGFGGRREAERASSGALWRWRDRRVVAYVSVPQPQAGRTMEQCRALFLEVARALAAKAPGGADGAAWYLESLFTGERTRRSDLPADFSERLLDLVRLEIVLLPPEREAFTSPTGRVACTGRLDARDPQPLMPFSG